MQQWSVGAILLLLIAYVMTKRRTLARATALSDVALPFFPLLNPLRVRVDSGGNGHFQSSRSGHTHQGTDYSCTPGQGVYTPFTGTIVRHSYPYATDLKWDGLLLENALGGYACKLFYCVLTVPVGSTVQRGQLIARTQAISQKYGGGVTNHIHCEIRLNGNLQNPEPLF